MKTFRVGTRESPLAVTQASAALERLGGCIPSVSWDLVPFSSPGDRDRETDLRASEADFFTRDLDEAVLSGALKAAVHSAKDVPESLADGLDWCWLPWREDPRDVLVFGCGGADALPPAPRVGVSSDRREAYCASRFPDARLMSIRGNIEDRLAQLDRGEYDVLVMAAAALVRLGLVSRIGEWIPLSELPTPEGQGVLCMTFRAGDREMMRVRSLFVSSVSFVGAGVGRRMCSLAGAEELENCQVCLHDVLLDPDLLHHVPSHGRLVPVGKRAGAHAVPQGETTQRILDEARRGYRVVRLKGGDPGVFGRLGEEVSALEALGLPYHVIPGVSSLNMATTGTGMLLTQRGDSRGFTVLTPRAHGGGLWDFGEAGRSALPLVLFMAGHVIDEVAATLLGEGRAPETPVAFVFNAGYEDEEILRATLGELTPAFREGLRERRAPSLCIVGEPARAGYDRAAGALGGRRVLVTCSETLQAAAARQIRRLGGIPVQRPLIRLTMEAGVAAAMGELAGYDWLVVTSPSAVRCLVGVLREARVDLRRLPPLVVCGPGTLQAVHAAGLEAAATPADDYGALGMMACVESLFVPGQRVLRVRSDRAGPHLAEQLREACGVEVVDLVMYRNEEKDQGTIPSFEAVLFASRSAVVSFVDQWGKAAAGEKVTVAIGEPTAHALGQVGLACTVTSPVATIDGALNALAAWCVSRVFEEE